MIAPLLITLREGVEAALIIGIVLAYLVRTGNAGRTAQVWAGTGLAVLVSFLVGVGIFATVGELEGTAEQVFEGSAMLLAVAILSYMVVWMRRHSKGIKTELHEKVQSALQAGSGLALALMAFVVVVREGIETSLFFFASTRSSSPVESIIGGSLGLALAGAIGYSIYHGSHRLNLRVFFNVTGVLLVVFAAGMLAHGIHEYQEAGLLPEVVEHLWNLNWLIDEESTVGQFLAALFGYNGNPSLVEVLAYGAYLVGAMAYFLGLTGKEQVPTRAESRRVA